MFRLRYRVAACALALIVGVAATPAGQARNTWTPPRTPDGQPDLHGVWDYRTATPLERPPQFAGKSEGRIYEYACHEGNYGLQNILKNARTAEEAR